MRFFSLIFKDKKYFNNKTSSKKRDKKMSRENSHFKLNSSQILNRTKFVLCILIVLQVDLGKAAVAQVHGKK